MSEITITIKTAEGDVKVAQFPVYATTASWVPIKKFRPEQDVHFLAYGDGAGFYECAFVCVFDGEDYREAFSNRNAKPIYGSHILNKLVGELDD
jgi:hypothetical protein